MMNVVQFRIAVLKRTFHEEWVEEYIREERKRDFGLCEVFQEGQEFITDGRPTSVPYGFCPWAWNDLKQSLVILSADGGSEKSAYRDQNIVIACCTDGTRPVFFKIEKFVTES